MCTSVENKMCYLNLQLRLAGQILGDYGPEGDESIVTTWWNWDDVALRM